MESNGNHWQSQETNGNQWKARQPVSMKFLCFFFSSIDHHEIDRVAPYGYSMFRVAYYHAYELVQTCMVLFKDFNKLVWFYLWTCTNLYGFI